MVPNVYAMSQFAAGEAMTTKPYVSGSNYLKKMSDLPPGEWPIWVQPWEMGYNPHSEVDRAIMATRQSVFPLHGMDPYFG